MRFWDIAALGINTVTGSNHFAIVLDGGIDEPDAAVDPSFVWLFSLLGVMQVVLARCPGLVTANLSSAFASSSKRRARACAAEWSSYWALWGSARGDRDLCGGLADLNANRSSGTDPVPILTTVRHNGLPVRIAGSMLRALAAPSADKRSASERTTAMHPDHTDETQDPRPKTQDPRPKTQDPRPKTQDEPSQEREKENQRCTQAPWMTNTL
jgi:hypothetical protein